MTPLVFQKLTDRCPLLILRRVVFQLALIQIQPSSTESNSLTTISKLAINVPSIHGIVGHRGSVKTDNHP